MPEAEASEPDAVASAERRRRLDPEERLLVAGWRLRAAEAAPYLASAIFAMQPVVSPGLGTFAVDRRWRLYLDLEQGRRWGDEAASAVLLHEVHHLLRDHHRRGPQDGTRAEHLRWNFAGDMAINDDLVAAGVPLPSPLLPGRFDFDEGLSEERYDQLLADELKKIRAEYGDERYATGHFKDATELFMRMSKSEQFDEFLSLPAYELLP